MFLGLLITLAYVPGWTGAAIPTGWVVLSLVLPFLVWRRVEMTLLHYLGLMFLAYAVLSLEWAPRLDDAIGELWHLGLFILAFIWGQQHGLKPLWRGMAAGLVVSSAIALIQWHYGLEWMILPTSDWSKASGLFYNNAVAGAVAALVLIGLLSELMFAWFLAPLPLLILSGSRGAWLAVLGTWVLSALAGSENWRERFFIFLSLIAPVIGALLWFQSDSDFIRIEIWKNLWAHSVPLGAGAGASQSVYMIAPDGLFHIEHAHNDFMNIAFEYGLGALPLALFVFLLLEFHDAQTWSPLVCALVLAGYFWPLEYPVTGFVLAAVAGRHAGELGLAWRHGLGRGLGGFLCNEPWKPGAYAKGR